MPIIPSSECEEGAELACDQRSAETSHFTSVRGLLPTTFPSSADLGKLWKFCGSWWTGVMLRPYLPHFRLSCL